MINLIFSQKTLLFINKHKSIIFLLILLTYGLSSYCIEIKGTVNDKESNEALVGAVIKIKSTSIGVITKVDGSFSISTDAKLPLTLEVSYTSYTKQEIEVSDEGIPLHVLLSENNKLLNEFVVIGYGTQKRTELTGSIASVSKATLEQNASSLDKLLVGAVAGVKVTQSSGQPGSGSAIRIRGGNSVYADNEPLYVIDGFIFYSDNSSTKAGIGGIESSLNPLAAINPADIESIEILKDVSATAIYGSRGANGVIIVTTKKGKRNGNTINYQYTFGLDKSAKKLDLMTASEWARIEKDYFFNKGKYTDEEIAQLGKGYDWQDAVLRTGLSQTHDLSISGGDEKTRYLISGNYTNQQGIILNSGFERFSGRVNLDKDISKKLTVGIITTVDNSTQNSLTTFEDVNYNDSPYSHGITNSLTYALYIPPVVPIYNSDNSYNYHNPYEYDYLAVGNKTANPVSDLKNSVGQTINTSLLGSFYAKYTIVKGLVAKVNAGTNISYTTQNFFAPSYTAIGLDKEGVGGIGNKRTTVSQMEYTLNYSKQINSANYIDMLAGYTYQKTITNLAINLTSHFSDETLGFNNLASGASPYPPTSSASEADLQSLIGRVNYTLLGRYNLTSTLRSDKSSRFAIGDYRLGLFPSIGLSWNVDKENFLKNLSPTLSSLKLRTTYGTVGNQEIGDYEYSQTFQASIYNGQIAYSISNLGNDKLKWETTTQSNAGIDVGFFKDRLTLVADVYYKKTSDLLLKIPVDPWSGSSNSQLENIGNVTNKGLEFAANANVLQRKNFVWTVSANIARNINKINKLTNENTLFEGNNQEEILKVNESLGSFYGLVFDGVVQTGENISKLPTTSFGTPKPGDIKFVDVNNDGKIDGNDRKVLGNIQPNFTYGFSSTLTYHRFNLYIALQGSQGNKVYNLLRRYLERPNDAYNMSAELLNSWTEENPSNTIPSINSPLYSFLDSRYVEDASYLKIKNITLSYNLPLNIQKSLIKLRIFATVQNLYTLTKYKGYDPEVAGGIDLGIYPTSRSFLAGVGITF